MSRVHRFRPLLAGLVFLASGGAFAASVTPTTIYGDNFTSCTDLPGGWDGLGFSSGGPPADPQTYDLGNGQSITFDYNPNGSSYIDFSATIPIDYVVVKGGNAYNIFHYDPATLSDTHLYAPDNGSGSPAGVSHVAVCFKPKPVGSKTAMASWKRYTDWDVQKSVTPTSISMFDGDSHEADYTVTVTPTTTGKYRVVGNITAKDPWGYGWSATKAVDRMHFNNDATEFAKQWTSVGGDTDTLDCSTPANDPNKVILSCSYAFELDSTAYAFLLNASGGLNKATITTKRGATTYAFDVQASFVIGAPDVSYGGTLSVDDNMVPGAPDKSFTLGGSYEWKYTRTFTCDADEGSKVNTATGTWTRESGSGSDSASATVNVACETVTMSKTANPSYSRDYQWNADKKIVVRPQDVTAEDKATACTLIAAGQPYEGNYLCDAITVILNEHGSYDTLYALSAVRSVASEYDFAVDGKITATWPAGMTPVFSGDPVDTLLPINQVVPVTGCATVANLLSCDYQSGLANKDALTNQAQLFRPHVCYNAAGGVIACSVPGTSTYTVTAPIAFGDPNQTRYACTKVSDMFNDGVANLPVDLLPGSGFDWDLDVNLCQSQTFYPTGDITVNGNLIGNLSLLADWAPAGFENNACVFDVPNLMTLAIIGDGSLSDGADIAVNVPSMCESGCTYTQGYWKTHSKYGPAPHDDTWEAIGEDTLFFSSGQSWYKVFWTPPQGGNAYYILAHQYMAARLNVEAGAGMPPNVQSAFDQATTWFTGRSTTAPKGAARNTAIGLAGILASYNEGAIGPGHCSVSPKIAE